MKSILIKSFSGLLAVLLLSVISFAQKAKRIDLTKEGPSIVWEERVPANSGKNFVFYLKKGQKVKIGFLEDSRQGTMDLGKFSIEEGFDNALEMDVIVSKDYYLSIYNPGKKATSFRLSIGLENALRSPKTNLSRISFAKGKTSASVTRSIPANGSVDFIVNAKKGQSMGFTVGYDFKDSDLEAFLTEPGMQDISLTTGPKKPNEFVIKKTGDHRLTVNNMTGKKITITVYLNIE